MTIGELKPGDQVEGYFALRRLELRESVRGGFLTLELGDRSGRAPAVMWDGFEDQLPRLQPGGVVKVRGQAGLYNERLQIKVHRIRPAKEDEAQPEDFLPLSRVPAADLAADFDALLQSLDDADLAKLTETLFATDNLRERFLKAPAAKLWHHATVGGLAEHSLNVARLCIACCKIYPELDRDLLICGALLHDIGKVATYRAAASFEFSDEGRLVGHINIGDGWLVRAIDATPDVSTKRAMLLRHLLVSHQGALEKGSPVVPMTLEAVVLNMADEIDSQIGGLRQVAAKEGDVDWSKYINLIDRFLYLGRASNNATPDDDAGEED